MEKILHAFTTTSIKLKHAPGDVVLYTHPDYDLKLIGRVIDLLSHEPEESQTLENSFAVIHQMDWISQNQFKSIARISVPGVLEFLDTNRVIEVPLSNIIRHFPVVEILSPDEYSKWNITNAFDKHAMKFNPIIVKWFNICNWELKNIDKRRFISNYIDDDIIPCCEPYLTLNWASRDLDDPEDGFYNHHLGPIVKPLIRADLREHMIPFLWSQIVSGNPNGMIILKERNKRIKKRIAPGRVEALIHEKAYSFLCDIIKDLKELDKQDAPSAIVALYLKAQQEKNLPEFIDAIDNEFDSLDIPDIQSEDEEGEEGGDDVEVASFGESVDETPVSKKAKTTLEEKEDSGDEDDEEEEEEEEEMDWDSEDDTNPSLSENELSLGDDDDEELEEFI